MVPAGRLSPTCSRPRSGPRCHFPPNSTRAGVSSTDHTTPQARPPPPTEQTPTDWPVPALGPPAGPPSHPVRPLLAPGHAGACDESCSPTWGPSTPLTSGPASQYFPIRGDLAVSGVKGMGGPGGLWGGRRRPPLQGRPGTPQTLCAWPLLKCSEASGRIQVQARSPEDLRSPLPCLGTALV